MHLKMNQATRSLTKTLLHKAGNIAGSLTILTLTAFTAGECYPQKEQQE
jgi:hypothetical protein